MDVQAAANRHSSDDAEALYELKLLLHGLKVDASIHRYHGTHQCGIAFLDQGVFIFRPRFQKRRLRQKIVSRICPTFGFR